MDDTEKCACLTAQEEQLLMSFADDECRWFGSRTLGRFKAQRLMARKESAREFIETLSILHGKIGDLVENNNGTSLWDRIENRIEQEERAEIYLRKHNRGEDTRARRIHWAPQFMWGASGAVMGVSASLLVLFLVTGSFPWNGKLAEAGVAAPGTATGGLVQPVAAHPVALRSSPVMKFDEPQAVQVEWMRSRGRVHVMNDPSDRSAIFWVRRNSSPSVAQSDFSSGSNEGEIRIIDKDAPSAITVGAR